jgi:PAS domain S-box-containing protein
MATQPTVLIVNDDPLQLRIATTVLRRDGCIVLSCPSAEEALRLLSEPGAVDAIVTDLYMPGIDGWRFCRLLRSAAFAQFNRIPILVVSAIFSGADAEELTVQLGADGFLAAPYEPATLCRAVRGLLVDTKPVSAKTVLLVGPDAGLAQELAAIFLAAGYRVAQAADGAQALSRFNQGPSQIVLLDGDYAEVMAPGMIETIKQPGTATVVIVMTSANSADLAMALLRKGADNLMQKSAVRQEVLQLCESAVRQRALLRIEELLQIRTQRLRDSEERYRDLFENAGDGIATYTLDGVIVSVNGALEALLTATRDVLAGKPYSRLMTAASFSDAKKAQDDARTDNQDSWVCALELACSDGAVVPVESHCRFLRSKGGVPGLVMATYRDLTAERRLERQRAEFTAMLAHDIRNPVGLICGYAEFLLRDHGAPVDAAMASKGHERIFNAAQVIESLVSNYLDFARIEAGRLDLSKRRFELVELLRRIVERFEGAAQMRAIRFQLHAQSTGIFVDGDTLALDRVIANLLNNAFKFTPDNGAISMSVMRRDGDAVIEVRDSGPGIAPERLANLFQKFNRIEIADRQEGVGLGLYIVSELVGAHGGKVEVASTPGVGTCFSVVLPLVDEA